MNKLVSYAADFASFLLERIGKKSIDKIILFGSVARDEAGEESDVDLFIECTDKVDFDKIRRDFFESVKYNDYWKLKGIKNDINIIAGKLDEWDLKNSVISNGITLYGKYQDNPKDASHRTILYWENIKPETKRVLLSKRIFGYSAGKKRYKGLLEKYGGERVSKGCIVVPLEHALVFTKLFSEMKVKVKIRKIIEYS